MSKEKVNKGMSNSTKVLLGIALFAWPAIASIAVNAISHIKAEESRKLNEDCAALKVVMRGYEYEIINGGKYCVVYYSTSANVYSVTFTVETKESLAIQHNAITAFQNRQYFDVKY